jgi:hypothetical protein
MSIEARKTLTKRRRHAERRQNSERRVGEMRGKPEAKPKKKVRNLPAKTLSNKHAKDVRGGAFQAHISIKGKKQGDLKGSL